VSEQEIPKNPNYDEAYGLKFLVNFHQRMIFSLAELEDKAGNI